MTIIGLKHKLSTDYPGLKDSMKSVLVTINREYAFDEAVIPSEAEIALFPPVSGG
jgi:molybdopterin converting factor small subunit